MKTGFVFYLYSFQIKWYAFIVQFPNDQVFFIFFVSIHLQSYTHRYLSLVPFKVTFLLFHFSTSQVHPIGFPFCFFPGFLAIFTLLSSKNNFLSMWMKYERTEHFLTIMNQTEFCLVYCQNKMVSLIRFHSNWKETKSDFSGCTQNEMLKPYPSHPVHTNTRRIFWKLRTLI